MIAKLKAKCEKFLKENGLDGDVHFYTEEEWKARGEPFGNGSPLSLTFEGALYSMMNAYWEQKSLTKLYEDFMAIGDEFGLYIEQGYAWSAHFYKI